MTGGMGGAGWASLTGVGRVRGITSDLVDGYLRPGWLAVVGPVLRASRRVLLRTLLTLLSTGCGLFDHQGRLILLPHVQLVLLGLPSELLDLHLEHLLLCWLLPVLNAGTLALVISIQSRLACGLRCLRQVRSLGLLLVLLFIIVFEVLTISTFLKVGSCTNSRWRIGNDLQLCALRPTTIDWLRLCPLQDLVQSTLIFRAEGLLALRLWCSLMHLYVRTFVTMDASGLGLCESCALWLELGRLIVLLGGVIRVDQVEIACGVSILLQTVIEGLMGVEGLLEGALVACGHGERLAPAADR